MLGGYSGLPEYPLLCDFETIARRAFDRESLTPSVRPRLSAQIGNERVRVTRIWGSFIPDFIKF